jgi:hypothetical protein
MLDVIEYTLNVLSSLTFVLQIVLNVLKYTNILYIFFEMNEYMVKIWSTWIYLYLFFIFYYFFENIIMNGMLMCMIVSLNFKYEINT